MSSNQPGQYYPPSPYPPEVQGASTTALILEIIFGIFGLLGVGHVYSGRFALGILLMIGWWIFIGIAAFISTLTLGIAGCLIGPMYLAIPIISGIQARTYVQRQMATGNWTSVILVAGGGCLLVVIGAILLIVFGVLSVELLSLLGMQ
jgi:hypothetical protein